MNDLTRQIAELLGWPCISVIWPVEEIKALGWGSNPDGSINVQLTPFIEGPDDEGKFELWVNASVKRLWNPDTDANQIDAAVREWCGEDEWRKNLYFVNLRDTVCPNIAELGSTEMAFAFVTATPEQKCKALIAAAKEIA